LILRRTAKRIRLFSHFISAALLSCFLASCAGGPETTTTGALEYSKKNEDEGAKSSAIEIGWFESRYGADRIKSLVAEGCSIAVPYVGSQGDTEAISTYLNAAAETGLGVALQIPSDFVEKGNLDAIGSWVGRFRDHPAVECWYLFDEPDVHKIPPERLATAASLLRSEGGGKPIAVTFYHPEIAEKKYFGSFDIFWINYYPVLKGTPEFLGISWGGFSARIQEASRVARAAKASFGVILQAYGKAEDGKNQFNRRLPTAAELNYMAWASLKENPSYLLFWSRYRTTERWLKEVFHPTMDPLLRLIAGGIEPSGQADITIQGIKIEGFSFKAKGKEYLALLASSRRSRETRVTIAGDYEIKPALMPGSVKIAKQNRNELILDMSRFSVALLEILR